jgi:hypothetical protein
MEAAGLPEAVAAQLVSRLKRESLATVRPAWMKGADFNSACAFLPALAS